MKSEEAQDREEAAELLEMWISIEDSHAALPPATRAWLKIGEPTCVKWPLIGFCGNHHGGHLDGAKDLAAQPGRFERFRDRIVNSRTQESLPKQRGMWRVYLRMRSAASLTAAQLLAILQAPASDTRAGLQDC